jgi:thiopeptide-type bacteriocin biosynthesis protein
LRSLVEPLVREATGFFERWFFIRYQDPRPHLRLRFFGPRAAEILPLLHARARKTLEEGRIARVQLDTYERELERYGDEEGVSLAETIFEADSECALSLIAATPNDPGADLRWRLLVRGIDQLLSDLGFTLAEKRAFARREKEGYGRELGAQDPFFRQLGARFRRERASLESLLDRSKDAANPALAAFAQRSERIQPLVPRLRALSVPLASLASSYVHMQANRLLRTAQRTQEACLHYFLERLYEGIQARSR